MQAKLALLQDAGVQNAFLWQPKHMEWIEEIALVLHAGAQQGVLSVV